MLTHLQENLGSGGTIFFSFYLWIIVGNGIRYGVKYLLITAFLCIAGFSYVMLNNPYWQNNMILGYGLLIGLLIVPLYIAKLINRLNDALSNAYEANKVKSQFLANMSHELRTPLTGIIASADMLKDEELEGEVRNKVNMIGESLSLIHI